MDKHHFDTLVRFLAVNRSRRGLLAGVASSLLAVVATGLGLPEATARKHGKRVKNKGKKKKGKKRPPPILNARGCVDVGQACRGDSTLCCSGICQGAPPQKGKPDTSVCVAHNTGGCTPERGICETGDLSLSQCGAGVDVLCVTTTGNAGFCARDEEVSPELNCRFCSTDRECEAQGFPVGSACVIVTGGACDVSNFCGEVNGSGTACFPPGAA